MTLQYCLVRRQNLQKRSENIIINEHDDIPIMKGKYMERHHSVHCDHDDKAELIKILQDPRRRLSETAAMNRDMQFYPLTGFEDVLVGKVSNTDKLSLCPKVICKHP